MSIIEFEIKNPRKKLEFYEQLHKENITRIEKLRKEKKQLKDVIEQIREYIEKSSLEVNTKEFGNLTMCNSDDLLEILDKAGDKNV